MTERNHQGEDKLVTIAESHDLERETVRAVVEELQAGAENPQVCEECGRAANAEADRYVARVPLTNTKSSVRCAECYANYVDEKTTLSRRESEVVTYLLVAGDELTNREISQILDLGSSVSKYRRRASEKYEQAQNPPEMGPMAPIMEAILYE